MNILLTIYTIKRLGVGVDVPTTTLDVRGASFLSGNVGINNNSLTSYPISVSQSADQKGIILTGYDDVSETLEMQINSAGMSRVEGSTNISLTAADGDVYLDSNDNIYYDVGSVAYDHIWRINSAAGGGTPAVLGVFDGNGKFGIGTASPSIGYKLDVRGKQLLSGSLKLFNGAITDSPGANHLWASGTGLYWGGQEVYTNAPGTSEITGAGADTYVPYFTATQNITGTATFTHVPLDTGHGTTGTTTVGSSDASHALVVRPVSADSDYVNGSLRLYYENNTLGGGYGQMTHSSVEGLNSLTLKRKGGTGYIGIDYNRIRFEGQSYEGSSNWQWNPGVAFNYSRDNVGTVWYNDYSGSGLTITSGSWSTGWPYVDLVGVNTFISMVSGSEYVAFGHNVGIGTASPRDYLEVASSADDDPAIRLTNSRAGTSGSLMIQHRGSSINFKSEEDIPMRFSMSNTEVMRTNADDTLSIGNTSAIGSGKVTILDASNPQLVLANDGSNYFSLTEDGNYLNFTANSGDMATMSLRDNGNTYFNGANIIFETTLPQYLQIKNYNYLTIGAEGSSAYGAFNFWASGQTLRIVSGSTPTNTDGYLMSVTQAGDVGIGTDAPDYKLDVTEGDGNFTGIVSRFTGGGSPELGISVLSGTDMRIGTITNKPFKIFY